MSRGSSPFRCPSSTRLVDQERPRIPYEGRFIYGFTENIGRVLNLCIVAVHLRNYCIDSLLSFLWKNKVDMNSVRNASNLICHQSARSIFVARTWEVSTVPVRRGKMRRFEHEEMGWYQLWRGGLIINYVEMTYINFEKMHWYQLWQDALISTLKMRLKFNLDKPVRVRGRVTGSESMMSCRSCSTSCGPTWATLPVQRVYKNIKNDLGS